MACLSKNEEKGISCRSEISLHWQNSRLDILVTQSFDNGEGFVAVSGIGYNEDNSKAYLNKAISFSYRQKKEFYYLKSDIIVNSPQMTMSLSDQKKWLPDFFITPGSIFLLKINPYGRNAWLFYTENSPAFVCESVSYLHGIKFSANIFFTFT